MSKAAEQEAAAEPKVARQHVVWVDEGHDAHSLGQVLNVPGELAEALRNQGRARFASDMEAQIAKDAGSVRRIEKA